MKMYFIYGVILFVACSQSRPEKDYDTVFINEYKNHYDTIGRLLSADIKVTVEMPHHRNDKNEAFAMTYCGLQQYEYKNDSEYTMKESFESSLESKIIRYANKTKEELHLKKGKDTVNYSFNLYYNKDKVEYEKRIVLSEDDSSPDLRYEKHYYYDHNGNNIKIVRYNLNTGQRVETYKFYNIGYQEALRQIPESDCEQNIECHFRQTVKDTIMTQVNLNGVSDMIVKEYVDGKKKIREKSSIAFTSTETEYEEDGLKVCVNHSVTGMKCTTDSVYYKDNKKVKSIYISSDNIIAIVTIIEYDKQGNITKEVQKSRWMSDNKSIGSIN